MLSFVNFIIVLFLNWLGFTVDIGGFDEQLGLVSLVSAVIHQFGGLVLPETLIH